MGRHCHCSMGISLAKAICVAQSGCCHILWSTTLVVAWCNLVVVAIAMWYNRSLTDAFVEMAAVDRPTSSQALWRFRNGKGSQFHTIDSIVSALAPSRLLMAVAQSPSVVRGSSLPYTAWWPQCGLSLPGTVFKVTCPQECTCYMAYSMCLPLAALMPSVAHSMYTTRHRAWVRRWRCGRSAIVACLFDAA